MTTSLALHVRELRSAFVDIGAHRLQLVGTAQQLLLLDRFGEQRRPRIDRKLVEHALGGADRIGAPGRDLARRLEGGRARIVADSRSKAVSQRLLCREY